MRSTRGIIGAIVLVLTVVTVSPVPGAPTPEQRCRAAKLKAAGKKAKAQLACHAKAFLSAVPTPATDPECLQKAEEKFTAAFTRAEAKGPCFGDPITVEAQVDAFATEVACRPPGSICSLSSECCVGACVFFVCA